MIKTSPEADLLTSYIEHDDQVLLIPTVLQEVLQGIRDDKQYTHIKEIFSYFTVLQISPAQAAIGAAEVYRGLRKKGPASAVLIAMASTYSLQDTCRKSRDDD